jgi:hypothetical protein
MFRLPDRAAASVIARPGFRPLRISHHRGLLGQSVAERLAKAAIALALLWLAIWWALS